MAAMTAMALAGMGMQGLGMAQQRQDTKLQQYVAKLEGQTQEEAYERSAEQLGDQQREQRASQRVAMAASGSSGQTQPLMVLAKEAGRMMSDTIEFRKTGQIARQRARSRSLLIGEAGKQQQLRGAAGLLTSGYKLGQTLNDSRIDKGNSLLGTKKTTEWVSEPTNVRNFSSGGRRYSVAPYKLVPGA